jgi:predicted HTH transcriptional regulator
MADLDLGVKMRQLDREAQEKLYTLRRQHETERALRIIESGAMDERLQPVEMTKLDRATLEQANIRRKMSKWDAITKTLQLLAENPNTSPSVIAEQIGRSRQTVYDYIEELQAAGKLNRDGHGQIEA